MVKEAKGGSDSIQEECADERRGWTLGDCQYLLDEQRKRLTSPYVFQTVSSPTSVALDVISDPSLFCVFYTSCLVSSFSLVYKLFNLKQRTPYFP